MSYKARDLDRVLRQEVCTVICRVVLQVALARYMVCGSLFVTTFAVHWSFGGANSFAIIHWALLAAQLFIITGYEVLEGQGL